ncbi:MAG: MobC family plasmid mobilization relaxosome protein [Pseudomonadota bacterium]
MSEKRTKISRIRWTDDEIATARANCPQRQLAPWLRALALEGAFPNPRLPRSDPALLRQLAAIGNNLNQIARRVNWRSELSDADRTRILLSLHNISTELSALRVTSSHHDG